MDETKLDDDLVVESDTEEEDVALEYDDEIDVKGGEEDNDELPDTEEDEETVTLDEEDESEKEDKPESEPETVDELKLLKEEIENLKKQLGQKPDNSGDDVFKKDFDTVKEKYPEIKETSIQGFGEEFMQLMATGKISAVKAYEATHIEEIKKMEREKGERKGIENKRSKDHLIGEGRGGAGKTINIPKETLMWYKKLNPGITDKEIAKHYTKSKQ